MVKNSLKKLGEKSDLISQENRQNILKAFGVVRRKKSKSLRYKIEAENLFSINTATIKKNNLGIGALRRDSSIFYDDYSLKTGDEDDKKLLEEIINMFEDGQLHSASLIKVENTFNFNTPLNIIIASYKPERDFIKKLVKEENAKKIDFTDFLEQSGYIESKEELIRKFDENSDAKGLVNKFIEF